MLWSGRVLWPWGNYVHTIAGINFGGSIWAILTAAAVTSAFAAALRYFIFDSRVSDVCLGVITLTVTLILFSLIRRTSGPEYRIGKALLGGFNGVSAPRLNLPWDSRAYKLGKFTIGAGSSAVGGVLFANGVGRVTPDSFSLFNAALTIIWVTVGGRGTLIGPNGAGKPATPAAPLPPRLPKGCPT